VRYTLEDAAAKMHLSKKSLDDFLLQLRQGRKYSFDFKKNKGELVGVLRNFNKAKRAEEQKRKKKTPPKIKIDKVQSESKKI